MGANNDRGRHIQQGCRFDQRSNLAFNLQRRGIGKDALACNGCNRCTDDTAISPDGWVVIRSRRAAAMLRRRTRLPADSKGRKQRDHQDNGYGGALEVLPQHGLNVTLPLRRTVMGITVQTHKQNRNVRQRRINITFIMRAISTGYHGREPGTGRAPVSLRVGAT
jgi:hypothetical protein